jgi:DNA-binding response OmpR family regulator
LLRSDPVTAAWMEHLRRAPVPSGQRVLFNRHGLASGDTATAMLWLDAKRVYLELRPHLRRLYGAVPDVDRALTALAPLGFAALPGAPVQIGEDAYWTVMNDFGPRSIDDWLSEVVGRELAAEEPTVLDPAARRLVLDGRSVDLSRLELDVLRHLQRREGVAVTRQELLREVWGHQWTGASSNVVEAVVSGLRRKMGDRAAALETVRGVGYRLGPLE